MPMELMAQKSSKKDNIFIQKAKIDTFNIEYDCKMVEKSKYTDHIGLRMTLEIEGLSFKPNFYIGGSFKTEKIDNSVGGWGTAYKVKLFFDALGYPLQIAKGSTIADNALPPQLNEACVGKEFWRLTYISVRTKPDGNNYHTDWQQVGDVNKSKDILKQEFRKAVDNNYVKDFCDPEPFELSGTTQPQETTYENSAQGLGL